MRKFPATPIMGVGVLTQALAAAPQQAAARSVDPVASVCDTDAIAAQDSSRALLADVLFSLSPAEKRAIAGDRIRLNMPTTKLAEQMYRLPNTPQQVPQGTNIIRPTATASAATCMPSAGFHAAVKAPQPHITPPRITTPK